MSKLEELLEDIKKPSDHLIHDQMLTLLDLYHEDKNYNSKLKIAWELYNKEYTPNPMVEMIYERLTKYE